MADVFTELAVKLRGPNPGTEEAQVTSTAGGALQVEEVGTSYAEDSVHTTADSGTFVLGVRNDTLASLVDTDGDYAPFQVNATGALYVDVSNTADISVVTNYEYAEDSLHTTADTGAFVLAVRNDAGTPLAGDGDYIPLTTDASGDLRVNASVTIGSEYAEDSVHTTGDVGSFVLSVRNDTLATLVDADGDYAPFQVNADGALYVAIDPSTTVTTNYEYAEDSVHTDADVGAFVLAVRNDAGTPLAADGDYIPLTTDASGDLRVNASVTIGSEYAEDSVHTTGDVGSFVLSVRNDTLASLVDADGDYAPFQVNADGALYVAIDPSTTVTTNYEYAEDSLHTTADIGAFVLAVRNDAGTPLAGDGDYIPLTTDASGDLRVNASVTIGSEYAEDSIHTTGDVGSFVLSVRNDTLASLVDADGDYAPFQVDALGALYVNVSNTTDISVATNYEYAEDSVHTSADVGAFVLAVRNDTGAVLAGTDGDYIPFSTDSSGALRVTGGTNSEYAEDTVHTTGDIGNFILAVRNDTLAALVDADGDYAPFQVNADGALYVDTSGANSNSEYVDDSVFTVATDVVTGVGMLADDTAPDSVDEGDIGIPRMTLDRRQLMRIGGDTDANRVNVDDGGMMLTDRIQDTETEHTYATVAAVANLGTGTVTHTVADGDIFYLKQVIAASSGAPCRVDIQYDDGGVTTLATLFYSDAAPYIDVTFDQPVPITGVSGGTDVEVVVTNRAGPAQDVYATIMGRNADLT